LEFPNSQSIISAMKTSNPKVDPHKITRENGMNKATQNGTAMNDMGIDWFAFQEALGNMGYMGIVDIEGRDTGHYHPLAAESYMDRFTPIQRFALLLLGVGASFYAYAEWDKRA